MFRPPQALLLPRTNQPPTRMSSVGGRGREVRVNSPYRPKLNMQLVPPPSFMLCPPPLAAVVPQRSLVYQYLHDPRARPQTAEQKCQSYPSIPRRWPNGKKVRVATVGWLRGSSSTIKSLGQRKYLIDHEPFSFRWV